MHHLKKKIHRIDEGGSNVTLCILGTHALTVSVVEGKRLTVATVEGNDIC